MQAKPSDYFLGAILRAYDKAKATGRKVTPSSLWDEICIECMHTPGGFITMFQWDTSKAKSKNRIGTIMETIEANYVPGLCMTKDGKGRPVVEELPF